MRFHFGVLSAVAALHAVVQASSVNRTCKYLPGDAAWPNSTAWQALNSSVHGQLLATIPPGAVCHSGWQQFNNMSCAQLSQEWTESTYHWNDPFSVDYNDDTCIPDPSTPCSAAGYPAYVLRATSVQDIIQGVNFARQSSVRLVVKGTGHDLIGRSSGAGSLTIYTGQMRGIEIDRNDTRATERGGVASIKISPGENLGTVNAFANDNNVATVTGSDTGVGIGGWISAGGHGPFTARFGMGSDQVLEMDIVTPDGILRTVNETQEPDLFWAVRGSGGSTFGVMTSVTVKAYAPFTLSRYLYSYNTTGDSDTFWSLTTYFHTQLRHLSESGLMSYYYFYPIDPTETNSSMQGKLYGEWLAPEKSASEMMAIIQPLEDAIRKSNWSDKVYMSGSIEESITLTKFWTQYRSAQAVGADIRIGSRLLGQTALEDDVDKLNKALRASTTVPFFSIGNAVAGPGARSPVGGIPGGSDAVNPAWRKAYTHIILVAAWATLNNTQKAAVTSNLRDVRTPALVSLDTNMGAYRNEADPTEPDWQQSFYGDLYPRLLFLKEKWDPEGVFWCKTCVGSELWDTLGSDGIENGVGQSQVRLCKKTFGSGDR